MVTCFFGVIITFLRFVKKTSKIKYVISIIYSCKFERANKTTDGLINNKLTGSSLFWLTDEIHHSKVTKPKPRSQPRRTVIGCCCFYFLFPSCFTCTSWCPTILYLWYPFVTSWNSSSLRFTDTILIIFVYISYFNVVNCYTLLNDC